MKITILITMKVLNTQCLGQLRHCFYGLLIQNVLSPTHLKSISCVYNMVKTSISIEHRDKIDSDPPPNKLPTLALFGKSTKV